VIALDHLVVAARSLEEGARWLRARLGVTPEPGGQHAGFGTHNRLLRLGSDVYLELIAADPAQPEPPRPRLFGLDEPATRALLERDPRLLHWVVRTDDLQAALARLAAASGVAPADLGVSTPMRRGDLSWHIAIRADGSRPPAGLPSVIDWGHASHPCSRMRLEGIVLKHLELALPESSIAALAGLKSDTRLTFTPSTTTRLAARLDTPAGETTLAG
jgi:hypothetical protein